MDPLQLLLAGLTGAAVAFLLPRLLRGRSGHSVVESALARIDARLDEQTRGQLEQAQSLRLEIEQRLSTGFDRADRTQADVVKRLALIDQAQQRLTELSSNVVSLQEVLADRSSRGAFGEVQLHALVSNVLPAGSFKMQYTLSTGRRADCMLFLPQPTGNIAIDSKFPLANFRRKVDPRLPAAERQQAGKAFARDVKTHISDVADKYILPGETCDSAVLFLPAEAVFAEIHAACPELVELAQQRCVWLTSDDPDGVLTTAALLRDAERGARCMRSALLRGRNNQLRCPKPYQAIWPSQSASRYDVRVPRPRPERYRRFLVNRRTRPTPMEAHPDRVPRRQSFSRRHHGRRRNSLMPTNREYRLRVCTCRPLTTPGLRH